MTKRGAPQKYGESIIPVAIRLPKSVLQAVDAAWRRAGAKNRSEWVVKVLKSAS